MTRHVSISPRRISSRQAGLTLLEVVIALGIMATIFVLLFSTYSAAVDRAARARELSQLYHEARVVLELMAADLRTAYLKDATDQAQQVLHQAKAKPYLFVGEDLTDANVPADKLSFSTFLPMTRPENPDIEVCRISYSLEPVADRPQERFLLRRVNCHFDPEITEREHLFPLTNLARGLDFTYYDARGTEYREWDSRQSQAGKRLPAWVKISLLLVDQHGQVRLFEMFTELVLSR
ncbi:MAG TPA: type II secretion system protein [Alphaproteobacteria bacterium]|nr:type II secretion system protein [Alphaproteobacteria bacterium]